MSTACSPALAARSGFHLALLTGNYEQAAQIKLRSLRARPTSSRGERLARNRADRNELGALAMRARRGAASARRARARAVVIGDTPHDVACARAAGARAIAVATGSYSLPSSPRLGADVALADLSDTSAVWDAAVSERSGINESDGPRRLQNQPSLGWRKRLGVEPSLPPKGQRPILKTGRATGPFASTLRSYRVVSSLAHRAARAISIRQPPSTRGNFCASNSANRKSRRVAHHRSTFVASYRLARMMMRVPVPARYRRPHQPRARGVQPRRNEMTRFQRDGAAGAQLLAFARRSFPVLRPRTAMAHPAPHLRRAPAAGRPVSVGIVMPRAREAVAVVRARAARAGSSGPALEPKVTGFAGALQLRPAEHENEIRSAVTRR